MNNSAILCLDDEETILTSLKGQLRRNFGNKFRYEFATSATEGLELIEELVEDNITVLLIVSDWLMPGMRGDEFLVQVHEQFPGIVKIMLTGHADEDAIERAKKEADLFRCIYKPWSETDLVQTITEGLESAKK